MKYAFRYGFALAVMGGLAGAAQAAPGGTDQIADVAESVVDSVVTISTMQTIHHEGSYDGDEHVGALGSGVIVNASGRILTNAHVVNGADQISVALDDGNDYDAKVVGIDPKTDVAVIQLEGKFPTLHAVHFGDSASLRLGETVLAIGNPLGVGKSVTMGIVSAKGRGGRGIVGYADFIQTDAAINQGNSGGALVNMKGELVGINTAIISRSGGYQGIGYAIPTNMAKPIMDMLVADGKVVRGYLGVNIQTVTPRFARDNKLGAEHGALVAGVMPGTPAALAGLSEGDVITSINGTPVKTSEYLMNQIAMLHPGATITLAVSSKDAKVKTLQAKLGTLDEKDAPQVQAEDEQGDDENDPFSDFQN